MSKNPIYFQYHIFRVTPNVLGVNTIEEMISKLMQTGIPLTGTKAIMLVPQIPGKICIDFDQLTNQRVYESSSKDGCTKRATELSERHPDDLFCVVQIPDSYLSGKKDGTNEKVGCVPFIKADFKLGQGSEWTIIPDLILEIHHSCGVVVANANYNLAFLPLGLQFTKEQLENLAKDPAAVAWLSTRSNYTALAQKPDATLGVFDAVQEHQAEVSREYVTSCNNPLRRAYAPQ